jgi:FKBP-type peptidyl-prolyl cis-trans isomerase
MKRLSLLSAVLAGATFLCAQNPVKFEVPGSTDNKQQPAAKPATQPAAAPAKAAPGSAPAAAPAATTPAPAPKFSEAQLFETYGWVLGRQMRLAELEFTPEQVRAMTAGLTSAAAGKDAPANADQMGEQLQQALGEKQMRLLTKIRNANLAEQLSYFIKLKENKNVVELPSGLRYEILKAGSGPKPKVGQVAKIHYKLSSIKDQVLQDSNQAGQPIELLLQEGYAINGMIEGLLLTGVGGKTKLYVPAHLAYGDEGNQGIPPGATLIFEVDLLEVKDAPKQEAADTKK